MAEQVEIGDFDLRYQGFRMRNRTAEKKLLVSILEHGIREPLQGVDSKDVRILLNGFKRYRCAKKLDIGIVPYVCLADEEAAGILELLRVANAKSLTILEQARLIDELLKRHNMSVTEIADLLERSKSWVSMRSGMIAQMSPLVLEKLFREQFPTYSYMYTLRPFMRMNKTPKQEIDEFVSSVAGKGLSIRDIDILANGYFKGPEQLRQQIREGNVSWALSRMKQSESSTPECTQVEQGLLRDLEIVQKYMCRTVSKSRDDRCKSSAF